ncbi:hypothetical protein ILUMI_09340, partial [Ignelater luminosus]
ADNLDFRLRKDDLKASEVVGLDVLIDWCQLPIVSKRNSSLMRNSSGIDIRQLIQQSLDNRPATTSTPEGPATDDNSYLGYSMVVGDFNGEGVQGVAVGMPRGGDMLQGKVLLYTWSLTNYINITGEQLGEYFGYAVAASDVDGDGRDDLIAGAPLHTEPNTEKKYEMGRVYIYYQGLNGEYSRKHILDGKKSKARFGLSLCTLGDLNLDGYGDFAVGAPYDGPNEAGAVYIFQGSASGVIAKYSQVIYAESVQASHVGYSPLSTFGFSLSGGLDLDGNDYPDLAVGAYLSDTAYFFRARPVVKINALIRFLPEGVRTIKLEEKKCPKPGSTVWVACTEIQVCLNYTGIGTPNRIELDLYYHLDSLKTDYSRMYLGADYGKEVTKNVVLFKDAQENCQERHWIYLDDQIVDKLTDLEISLNYSLRESYYQQTQRDPRSILVPIVDLSRPTIVNDSISIYKNCGLDNVCIPDLQLSVNTTVNSYVYEVGKSLEFDVMIKNVEDDSYNTKFFVHFPKGITFKVASKDDGTKLPCSSINETLLSCDIGNPLPKSSVIRFKLKVEPLPSQKILEPTYFFFMNVTSANPENSTTLSDNARNVSVDILVKAVLAIEGKSTPPSVYYNLSQYQSAEIKSDIEIGPSVIHSYTVTNNGPSDVEEVEIFIIWPMATSAGEDLLYLLEAPHTLGGVKCDPVDSNYREYPLALQKNVWNAINIKEINGSSVNIITRTLSNVTFYNLQGKKLQEIKVIGERETKEYWDEITTAASRFSEPVRVRSNSSSLVIKYEHGKEYETVVDHKQPNDPANYAEYNIDTSTITVIRYYRGPGNLIHEENITAETGSKLYKEHIERAKLRLGQPLLIETETTKRLDCKNSEGKVIHQQIFTSKGKEVPGGTESTVVTYYTVVTFHSSDGSVIKQEIIKEEPRSHAYWEQINEIISKYQMPVHFTANTTKIVKHYINEKETVQQFLEPILPHEQSITPQHKTTTTVTVKTARGETRTHAINAEKGSEEFNKQFNAIVSTYTAPFTVITETIVNITYLNNNGQSIHTGIIKETEEQYYRITQAETNSTTTISTVLFYDNRGNLIRQEEIRDNPESTAFWDRVNRIAGEYHQQIRILVTTRTKITFYVNGQPVRTQDIGQPLETAYTTQIATTVTSITVHNSKTSRILQEQTIPVEIGTTAYNDYIKKIINSFRDQPITIVTKTTYTITYRDSTGRVKYTGTSYKEERQSHEGTISTTTTQTRIITTILFYGPEGNILHRETISDSPGSAAYWERIRNAIVTLNVPLNIYTNTSESTTYYINGVESHTEHVAKKAGKYDEPFTPQIEISNVITFYDSNRQVISQRTLNGELTAEDTARLLADFNRAQRGQFTMETNTTKTITYVSRNGNVLHSDAVWFSPKPNTDYRTKVVTETTFTVYGPDRRTIIHQETIQGEPGSTAYNNVVSNIISKYPGSITIYTNSTKTITYYNAEGRSVEKKTIPEPRSTVQQESTSTHGRGTTSIIFYGADGKPIHREDIQGLLGHELNAKLNEIARGYEGVMKNYEAQYTQDRNVGGSVTHVDTPYPGNRPHSSGHHFTDFGTAHNQGQTQWNTGYNNQSYQYNEGRQSGGYDQRYGGSFNLQSLDVNQHDLGSFAKGGQGFRTGGIDLGISSGVIDQNVDGQARNNFETRTSYDGSHNYLSGVQTHGTYRHDSRQHNGRNKRQVDTTDNDIKKLSNCATSRCVTIRCVTGPIKNRHEVHIALRARINVQTLKNISTTQPVDIQSMLLARISHFQGISGLPAQRLLYRQQIITSVMAPKPDVKPDIVPLWVVIVSAVAGTLILLLLIFLLHKVGCFYLLFYCM